MIRLRDAADGWVSDVRLSKKETWLLFLNPPVKIKLVKVKDAADRWVPDVRLSEQYVCYLDFIFEPVIAGYLAFIFEPAHEIQTCYGRGLLTGGSLMSDFLNNA
jgi:hypothetical protein